MTDVASRDEIVMKRGRVCRFIRNEIGDERSRGTMRDEDGGSGSREISETISNEGEIRKCSGMGFLPDEGFIDVVEFGF